MKNFQTKLLRIKNISGMFYQVPRRKTSRLVIYGIGAPLPPDTGLLPDAKFILDFNVDLFVPDYLGFGRSDGVFTPKNCIKTFLILFDEFTKASIAQSGYLHIKQGLQYDEVFFIGRSFGGMYITWLPLLNPKIKNLCLVYPILDYVACGKIPGEETTDGFMKAMNQDGYKHLYRGINRQVWQKHLHNKDELCPMEQVNHLKNTKMFIAHGKNDKNINFSHSVKYVNNLLKTFPKRNKQFELKLYPGDHSPHTSNKAVVDYLKWMKIPKAINDRK